MLWLKILDAIMNFGMKAVKWAWDNKLLLISLGVAVFEFIASIWTK